MLRSTWLTTLTVAGVLALTGVTPGCEDAVGLSASSLEVIPNPAQAGDSVSLVFALTVVPKQSFTLVTRIDGVEHSRTTRNELVDGLQTIEMGDAADLVAGYGLGAHLAAVEVRLIESGRTATSTRTFELREPTPTPAGRH